MKNSRKDNKCRLCSDW